MGGRGRGEVADRRGLALREVRLACGDLDLLLPGEGEREPYLRLYGGRLGERESLL